jgi:hypothetical protein
MLLPSEVGVTVHYSKRPFFLRSPRPFPHA